MKRGKEAVLVAVVLLLVWSRGQGTENNFQAQTRLQPIAAQVRQLESLHRFLGEPFSQSDEEAIDRAIANPDPDKAAKQIEEILDKHALVVVTINSESLVRVTRGQGRAELVQNGVRIFLMKIVNHAGIAAPFKIESPNSGPVYRSVFESASRPLPPSLDAEKIRELWMEISLCVEGPLAPHLPNDLGVQAEPQLSGSTLEYRILLIYSRDAGQRSAKLSFILGQNARVSSSSNEITVHFNIASSPDIKLHVLDDDSNPTMASFIFRDSLGRVYPNPEKRLAPDFYFEPQVYRADGEVISLPPGSFTATFTGGPEYLIETQNFIVDTKGPNELTFHLKRWISPASTGWYSGDHHIHANGGAYYMDPTFGVLPQDMARQVRG
ncbi:MAG: hypothetical protein WB781_19260, partial [Candidatus Sulfotelmatobacter sp.]